ncbi:MAG: serpin family protein [Candidatus Diapherotrites archaeon]|nr:serpin family protein [Candidatus Diapherotrites archaeon]
MIKKNILIVLISLFLISVVFAAALLFLFPYEPKNPPTVDDSSSTAQGIQEVVRANNKFAFDLYAKFSEKEKENIFYSPYSISSALAMTYEGAKGQTAEEMKKVLHLPQSNILRPNFAAIYNKINAKGKPFELRTGNALWTQKNYPFIKDYLSLVEKYYGGKAAELDFINDTEKSRQTINSFIEEQTNGKIKDLIPIGSLDPLTRLVITNAIYFKGTWLVEFDPKDTIEADFIVSQDKKVKVQMMHMAPEDKYFNYAETEELQLLELPYSGEELSMLILLPKKDLASVEKNLTEEKLSEYKKMMQKTKLALIEIPKFEINTKYFMVKTLKEMGINTAFGGSADFTGMTPKRELYISEVIHQAYAKVDEKGTEAAAATAVIMKATSARPEITFVADHPFIFLIQHKETGTILFVGRVINPNA